MKEEAWGAHPRVVSAAALLGVRLNNRRPAPICMGGCAAQGVGLGGPSPVAQTPGLAVTALLPPPSRLELWPASRVCSGCGGRFGVVGGGAAPEGASPPWVHPGVISGWDSRVAV